MITREESLKQVLHFKEVMESGTIESYYLHGLFVADATINEEKVTRGNYPQQGFCITQHAKNKELIDSIESIIGIQFKYYNCNDINGKNGKTPRYQMKLSNRNITQYFIDVYGFNKEKVFESFRNLEGANMWAFLSGFIDGDGCITVAYKKYPQVKLFCYGGTVYELIKQFLSKTDLEYKEYIHAGKVNAINIRRIKEVCKLKSLLYQGTPFIRYKRDNLMV